VSRPTVAHRNPPRRRAGLLAAAVACLALLCLPAAGQALPDAAAVQVRLDALLDRQGLDPKGPGLAVLVARGDERLAQGARGMASIELEVPLTPAHRFKIASITKQFTAAWLLELVDQGRARLDDPLSKYLADYPNGRAITLAMLLNHTAGVPSFSKIPGYLGNPIRRDLGTAQLIDEFKFLQTDFSPGQGWAYSNGGYVLLGAVIEKITGKPWWEGASRLQAPLHFPAPDRLIAGLAQGYSRTADGRVRPAGLVSMTQPHAASALVGDLHSLWHWNRQLHESGWLSSASHRRMTTPDAAAQAHRYGYGLLVAGLRGKPLWMHGGVIHGFTSLLSYQPADRVSVVLLRNSDTPTPELEDLARELGAFAAGRPFPEPPPVSLDAARLKAFEGVYGSGSQQRTMRVVDGQLHSQRTGQRAFVLQPVGPARFRFPDSPTQLGFVETVDGRISGLRIYPEGDGEGLPHDRTAALPAAAD
jgi:D-alanyl-D-alanine carboxypeptidase